MAKVQKVTKFLVDSSPYHSKDDKLYVELVRNEWIRIHGKRSGKSFDITFKKGDTAEYDSYNLNYLGKIVSITEAGVSITKGRGQTASGRKEVVKRLKHYEFIWRNYDFDEARINAQNSETMNYI